MHIKGLIFMLNIVVMITERSQILFFTVGFAVVIDITATHDAKKPGSERALILKVR
jgi:hypothetical protein